MGIYCCTYESQAGWRRVTLVFELLAEHWKRNFFWKYMRWPPTQGVKLLPSAFLSSLVLEQSLLKDIFLCWVSKSSARRLLAQKQGEMKEGRVGEFKAGGRGGSLLWVSSWELWDIVFVTDVPSLSLFQTQDLYVLGRFPSRKERYHEVKAGDNKYILGIIGCN